MPKKLTQAKLLRKYEKFMREIIKHRDGNKCQVPNYRHRCSDKLCADHRPSKRGNHSTFFDVRNLTCVCGTCNMLAEFDPFISQAIVDLVIEREGDEAYEDLARLSKVSRKWQEDEIIDHLIDTATKFGAFQVVAELSTMKEKKCAAKSPKRD